MDTETQQETGDDFDSAFTAAESELSGGTEAPEPAAAETAAPEAAESAETLDDKPSEGRDDKGRFAAKTAAQVKPTARAAPAAAAPAGAVTPPVAAEPAKQAPEPIRAPQSWKATEREAWAQLPRVAQEAIQRRERESAIAMSESAEARKQWGEFSKVAAPYQAMIQAEGGTLTSAAASLFQTAAALRTAPPSHKAQLVAGIIKQFGIDVPMLADALDGQQSASGQQQQPQAAAPFRDPRFDQFLASLQQSAQSRESQLVQAKTREAEAFASKSEFFEDVREEMADLIELYAKRGVALDYADAYNRAVQGHPEISAVLKQRTEAKLASNATASTQRARIASSSIRSRPISSAPAPTNGSLEEDLEASISALSGR